MTIIIVRLCFLIDHVRESDNSYRGPAPEANLIGVKVLNKQGSGTLADIIEGVEWCIQYNEDNPDEPIDIISLL